MTEKNDSEEIYVRGDKKQEQLIILKDIGCRQEEGCGGR